MEDQWLAWAKRLQSIASTGLHFCDEQYDRERYTEVADIANAMLARLGNVPIERIQGLISDFAQDYATPKIDVRGAVLEEDKVLLVREASDGLWTLPGGYADVGLSAGENVVKEIWEEATLKVRASALYAVHHKAKHAYDPDVRDFYKLFFLCERLDDATPAPGPETVDAGFFSPDALPPLSRGRVVERDIRTAFAFRDGPDRLVQFD
jgi:ADP-ribose pyrophosphatase YjhB (NUDIX family)